MNRSLLSIFWLWMFFASTPWALAQQESWPRTLPLEVGEVTIYALQVDEMKEDTLHYRAALAYRPTAGAQPVFGAGWFESRVDVDRETDIVRLRDMKVTETRFPAGTDDVQPGLAKALAVQAPGWNLTYSLDELQSVLKTADAQSRSSQDLNTKPPKILYRDHPALLVSIDGNPILRQIEDSPYQAVINTPYPLITDGRTYYLNAAKDVWYRAAKATGPYRFDADPPADIAAMVKPDETGSVAETTVEVVTANNAPEVVVTTEPAELLVTDGPAAFVPLVDDLLVLQNSEDDVFMHVSTQKFYIVLAGRWYHSGSLDGPWNYRAADELPTAFASIPEESDQADARVYIAGTEEARDAVLDSYVPQTAAVARGEVDIDVAYDGEPSFQSVDGADLTYADNTDSTVLQSDRLYYLVEDGVWYVSASPRGPWQVSDYRPQQVETILPSSPVYNVRYVYVYDSTPEVVYVGYTPGYTGSYIYHNTIVYGTGWYYRPWVSHRYYYPRHSTWGFNVSYDPWYGWNFGLSWNWGPFSVGYYPGGYWHRGRSWYNPHYGYWGPHGYRHRTTHYGHDRYRGNHGDRYAGRRNDYGTRGYGSDRNDGSERNRNLYRDHAQRARIADTRDRSYQPRNGRDDAAGRAGNAVSHGTRGKTQIGDKKVGRSRTGPVRTSDLAVKARQRDDTARQVNTRQVNNVVSHGTRGKTQIGDKKVGRSSTGPVRKADLAVKARARDDNLDARQRRLIADARDDAYRGTRLSPKRGAVNSGGSKTAKGERNRTMPVPGNGGERLASLDIKPTVSRSSSPRPATKRDGQRSSPPTRTPARQSQARASENSSRQRSSTASRQTQARPSGSSSQPRYSTPARPVSSRTVADQNRQQSPRAVTAPAPKPQPRGTNSRQRTQQAAPPSRQQKSHQNASGKKSQSKGESGNRRTDNRSRSR